MALLIAYAQHLGSGHAFGIGQLDCTTSTRRRGTV
jgi:hypothetical protein